MPKVKIPQLNKVLNVDEEENLFLSLKAHHVPIASSCGGEAVCGKCIVRVKSSSPLHSPNDLEAALISKLELNDNVRVSCQLAVHSDIEIETDYW